MPPSDVLFPLAAGVLVGTSIGIISEWRRYRRVVRTVRICVTTPENFVVMLSLLGCGRDSFHFQLALDMDDNALPGYLVAVQLVGERREAYIKQQWLRFRSNLYLSLTIGAIFMTVLPLIFFGFSYL